MKEKIRSFEEFEERLRHQPTPKIQSIEVFEEQIFDNKRRSKPYLKVSIATVLISLFSFVTISFAIETIGWKFFNDEGEQFYEIQPLDKKNVELEKERHQIDIKYDSIRNDIRENLSEGKFAYFLPIEGYELDSTSVGFIVNNQKLASVADIPSNLTNFLHFKDGLLDTYTLSEGLIQYELPEFDATEKAEELYLKAKKEGVPYIVQEGDLTSEVSSLNLIYNHIEKNQGIQINILNAGKGMSTTQDLNEYTKIKEMGMDFLYNNNDQELLFILEENGKNLVVEIRFTYKEEEPVKLEELMSIVRDIINN